MVNPISVCKRCGNSWWRRQVKLPKKCPVCFSINWNKEREKNKVVSMSENIESLEGISPSVSQSPSPSYSPSPTPSPSPSPSPSEEYDKTN